MGLCKLVLTRLEIVCGVFNWGREVGGGFGGVAVENKMRRARHGWARRRSSLSPSRIS
uniref:Uncharacterized protein n=1 Tax=Fagus sylvatica TaxID=28930 RepID=A0A2N9EYS6_FAGSY